MRLKSWGRAALYIATIALVPEYSIFVPRLRAQEANRQEQQHVIPALDGPTLFMTYCAVCHGRAADGRGPMAPILKTAVPDLTKIAKGTAACSLPNASRTLLPEQNRAS
jgi:mono/diheme cytochrome c family protein